MKGSNARQSCSPASRLLQANCLLLLFVLGEGFVSAPRGSAAAAQRLSPTLAAIRTTTFVSSSGSSSSTATDGSSSLLEQLQKQTRIWGDTAEFEGIPPRVEDATTNPSIVSSTAQQDEGLLVQVGPGLCMLLTSR